MTGPLSRRGKTQCPVSAVALAVALAAMVALAQCVLPGTSSAESVEYVVKSDRIVLAWDPPPSGSFGPTAPVKYAVYYRPRGESDWVLLGEVDATESPEFTVWHEGLGNGLWEFGVRTMAAEGRTSLLHSSVDETASPFGGWHVHWIRTD